MIKVGEFNKGKFKFIGFQHFQVDYNHFYCHIEMERIHIDVSMITYANSSLYGNTNQQVWS